MPTFCFICGLMGHSENFFPSEFDVPQDQITRLYGAYLRAAPRRRHLTMGDQWLKSFEDVLSPDSTVSTPRSRMSDTIPMVVEDVLNASAASHKVVCSPAISKDISAFPSQSALPDDDMLLVLDPKRKRLSSEFLGPDLSTRPSAISLTTGSVLHHTLRQDSDRGGGSTDCIIEAQNVILSDDDSTNLKVVGAGSQTHLHS